MKDSLPNFKGKAVSFALIDEPACRLLVDIRFEMQAGRLFVVGTSPPGGSRKDWLAGLIVCHAWDRVTEYIAFQSVDHYYACLSLQDRKKRNRKE